ncbi:MAG: M57 family metalloprotease [Bacteroidota bacterium]
MHKFTQLAAVAISCVFLFSCQKDKALSTEKPISEEVKAKVKALGFGVSTLERHEDGYMVEGDIILTEKTLNSVPASIRLQVANVEQYSTFNVVSPASYPTIKVAMDARLAAYAGYPQALTEVVNRYNAENLSIQFQLSSIAAADILFINGNGNFLASAGFPGSDGSPYGEVKVNARAIGSGTSATFTNYLATILAHEAGHCIGFRHTDWFNRAYSCGGAPTNEGQSNSGVGAVLITGTPSTADAGSFMLSCIGNNVNRPFNANDKKALDVLF